MPILPQDGLEGIRLAGPGYEAAYPIAVRRESPLIATLGGIGKCSGQSKINEMLRYECATKVDGDDLAWWAEWPLGQ